MGSSFFSDFLNPGRIFGSQSTMGKAIFNDPINRASGNRIVPENGNYGSGNWQGTVAPPNAYAGVPATLAAANTGYGTLPPAQQQPQQRPVGGPQAQPPFSFNVPTGAGAARAGSGGGGWS